mmetsp:Transcript_92739/g.145657  ORF Transcript_92739/g.145657 Transcript_92739/m.145657 type:complete len:1197 (+) Transcript_92739:159-3749(+)
MLADPADPGAASAEPTSTEEVQQTWPPPEEQLEKWMMNTVKEGDQCARFLRTLLQMNPAYGTYLTTDPDLFGVIKMFSKRLRTKLTKFENTSQMPPDIFHQTLCEMLWRIVGWVMHEVVELEEDANMPVPKEASGMIKMLLNTNTKLTTKLNDVRRAYLKELAAHRDRQRHISAQTQRAIDQLHESPIMFFDPLAFVLDESTKSFVREVIEERMKLEMRTNFQSNEDNAEITSYIEELEGKLELANAELQTCRATNNRLEEQLKTQKEREAKLLQDLKTQKEELAAAQEAAAAAEEALKQMQGDMNKAKRRIEHLEQKASGQDSGKQGQSQYVDLNKEELSELREKVIYLEKELKFKTKEVDRFKQMHEGVADEEQDSKKLLLQAMQVEKELRAANEALEKALKETEAEMKEMEKELKSLGRKLRGSKEGDSSPTAEELAAMDAEFEKKLRKATTQQEKLVGELQNELDKLREQLKEANLEIKGLREGGDDKKPKQKVVKQVGVPEEDFSRLQLKCDEQEKEIERLETDMAALEQKCSMLMEKLKDKFTDAEIANIVEKIKLAPPPKPKKERKKKAYERLYDDAQRRIGEMKLRQNKLKDLEERQMAKLSKKVKTPEELRKLDILHHLHRASSATAQRFHDALSDFDKQTRRKKKMLAEGAEDVGSGGESSGDDEEEVDTRRNRDLSDLEQITLMTYKIGVCPRCAFSAMSAFQRRHRQEQRVTSPKGQAKPEESGTPWGSVLFLTEGQVPGRTLSSSLGRSYSDILGSLGTGSLGTYISDGSADRQDSPNAARTRSGSPVARRAGSPVEGTGSSLTRISNQAPSRYSPHGVGTPLGGGPLAGPLPYDAAFPLPTPPWRQEPEGFQIPPMPSQAQVLTDALSRTGPLRSQTDSTLRGGVHTKAVATPPQAPALRGKSNMPSGETLLRDAPPWRRERSTSQPSEGRHRSQSPEEQQNILARSSGAILAQPLGGAPPPRSGGMESLYGRLGRHLGSEWSTPLAPGRLPAAQTMPLDPIVKFAVHTSEHSPRKFDRSMSPEWTAKRPEGFRGVQSTTSDLELDCSRPSTVPASRKVPMFRRSNAENGQPAVFRSETGGEIHTFGGGARATIWKDAGSTHLPSVQPSRSSPNLATSINGRELKVPWHGPEVPWENSSPQKQIGSKSLKKSGVGFVVTPLQSQQRLSATMPGRLGSLQESV